MSNTKKPQNLKKIVKGSKKQNPDMPCDRVYGG